MSRTIRDTVLDCILDLGVTVIYAALAGLAIVAIVASDSGPMSFAKAAVYASLLPCAVVMLIGVDLGVRLLGEIRTPPPSSSAMRIEENSLLGVARTE